MRNAAKPQNESLRLAAPHRYGVLDKVQEQIFDDVTALASNICDIPITLTTFAGRDRFWIESGIGISTSEAAHDIAFCAHAIVLADQVLVVRETVEDDCLCDNPLVTNDPYICFFIGASLLAADDLAMWTVCAHDNLLNFVRIDHAHLELRPINLDQVIQGLRADRADAIARCGARAGGFNGESPTFETGAGALDYLCRADPGVPCLILLEHQYARHGRL